MKNRILPLFLSATLLAGALTLTSCTDKNGNDDPLVTVPVSTEDTSNNSTVFLNVNETVYTTADLKLHTEPSTTSTTSATTKAMEELNRTGISEDGRWSRIDYDGKTLYAASSYLSSADYKGRNFDTCDETEMFVSNLKGANIRTYASSNNDFSPVVGDLNYKDEITVIGSGIVDNVKWYKVLYNEQQYFTVATNLSDGKAPDYSANFTDVTPYTMYSVGFSHLHSIPDIGADSRNGSLEKDEAVTVLKTGTGDYSGWLYVKRADKVKEGDTPTYTKAYIKKSVLSLKKSTDQATPEEALDELLLTYTDFTKITAKTVYAKGTTNLRESPSNSGKLLKTLAKNDTINAVASGERNDTTWYILQDSEGALYFAGEAMFSDTAVS